MSSPVSCTSCSTPIPAVVAMAPFCPFCGARKQAPGVPAGVPLGGPYGIPQVAPPGRRERPKREERPFSESLSSMTIAFDPRAGYALFGAHEPDGEPARLRAWDLVNKRVAWEALARQLRDDSIDYEGLRIHAGNVYAAFGRNLRALDLFTGEQRWGAELPDELAYDSSPVSSRGVRVFDAAPSGAAGAPGVVWAIAIDNSIHAFDRNTGQRIWREERENAPRRVTPLEPGMLLVQTHEGVDLVDPVHKTIFDKVHGRIERVDLEGRFGLFQVRDWGFREREGIVVHDFGTRKEVLFEAVEDPEDDVPSVIGFGRVFCATESGAKLFAGPHGRAVELMPGFHIKGLTMNGPTLMVLLAKHHGTSYRRILGVDPMTLAIRFDLGELMSEPNDDFPRQMCSNGAIAVIVTSQTGDDDDCELWGVDARGAILWRTRVASWQEHWFLGGNIVVSSGDGWRVLRPDTGQAIASLTW